MFTFDLNKKKRRLKFKKRHIFIYTENSDISGVTISGEVTDESFQPRSPAVKMPHPKVHAIDDDRDRGETCRRREISRET